MIIPQRWEEGREMLLAGLAQRFDMRTRSDIPALWARFAPSLDKMPGQIGSVTYGVSWNSDADSNFDYMAAVEVKTAAGLPQGFTTLCVLPQHYAVFHHQGHVSSIGDTLAAIWTKWLPGSGHQPAPAPCLECYDERFDPGSGHGVFEIWIPIQP